MIAIRKPEEIALLKESGHILALAKRAVYDAIKPGVSTQELDDIAYNVIVANGAKPAFKGYGGFPGTCCISVNEEMIHGIPGKRILKEGDIVKVDCGAIWKGYYSDSAFTKGVGKISSIDEKLIETAKNAFYAGISAIKPGARVGDIEAATGKYARSQGFYVSQKYSGHGVGTHLHEDPFVHNDGIAGTGPLLKDGMVLAIEPMILQTNQGTRVLKDKWTVVSVDGLNTSHYEHTIVIVNGQAEIITGEI